MHNIRAVLFDVDDTLFDRKGVQPVILEIIVKRFPDLFKDLEMARIAEAFAESDIITTRDFDAGAQFEDLRQIRNQIFLRILGLHADPAQAITDIYVREYPTVNAPVPGASAIVVELGRKYLTGVVSNGFPDVQYTKLETISLRKEFSCIVLSEEIGIRKPDPRIFKHAASLLTVEPGDCLHVGDSYTNDVIGAKNAGMQTCWFNRDYRELTIDEIQPDLVIRDLTELAEILK